MHMTCLSFCLIIKAMKAANANHFVISKARPISKSSENNKAILQVVLVEIGLDLGGIELLSICLNAVYIHL